MICQAYGRCDNPPICLAVEIDDDAEFLSATEPPIFLVCARHRDRVPANVALVSLEKIREITDNPGH